MTTHVDGGEQIKMAVQMRQAAKDAAEKTKARDMIAESRRLAAEGKYRPVQEFLDERAAQETIANVTRDLPPVLDGSTQDSQDILADGVPISVLPAERKLRAYVAGPMRGLPAFGFPAFHDAAEHLNSQGFEVFSPAARDEAKGFDPTGMTGNEDLKALGFDLREALGADLAWITANADVVFVLPGWEYSKGANAEVATAHALGIPVKTMGGDPIAQPKPFNLHFHGSQTAMEQAARKIAGAIEVLPNGAKQSRLAHLCGEVPHADLSVAAVLAEGASKYGRRNWHGIPVESNVEHALAHILHWMAGKDSGEDDMAHAATRLMMALDQRESGRARCAGCDPLK